MTSIQSLPAPPTEMLKEANKEQAKYMNEMLRIALGIKEFRIHAKPIIGKKLTETPSAKCINDRIKNVNSVHSRENEIERLTNKGDYKRIIRLLFEPSLKRKWAIQEKFNRKKQGQYYALYYTNTHKRINWRFNVVKNFVDDYYTFTRQLKEQKISLEKRCALAIAYIMIRKTQRWEQHSIFNLDLNNKKILEYALKYSPEDIIKNRKLLLNADYTWKPQN